MSLSLLQLNNSKAKKDLNWNAKLNINETIDFVVDWYKNFKNNRINTVSITRYQIKKYMKKNYESSYSCWWIWSQNI